MTAQSGFAKVLMLATAIAIPLIMAVGFGFWFGLIARSFMYGWRAAFS